MSNASKPYFGEQQLLTVPLVWQDKVEAIQQSILEFICKHYITRIKNSHHLLLQLAPDLSTNLGEEGAAAAKPTSVSNETMTFIIIIFQKKVDVEKEKLLDFFRFLLY
jgi:hypothetical protein